MSPANRSRPTTPPPLFLDSQGAESDHAHHKEGLDDSETQVVSPVMAQYFGLKERHPECLLFFRLGDFYELFFEDAEKASHALDLTLTKRGQHHGKDIPMCGVPAATLETYLARLVRKGFRVALAEQTETPEAARQRGGKPLVRREVVRVVTAGTVTEDALLETTEPTVLACLVADRDAFGLAVCDLGVGEPAVHHLSRAALLDTLAALDPREIVLPDPLAGDPDLAPWRETFTTQPTSRFHPHNAAQRIRKTWALTDLSVLGTLSEGAIIALGALLDYLALTQQRDPVHLTRPRVADQRTTMGIDPATRRHLEITHTLAGTRTGSLIRALDCTITGAGSRLLKAWITAPLIMLPAITQRQDGVTFFVEQPALRATLREALRHAPDLERALSRLSLGRGSPRDLGVVRDALVVAQRVRTHVLAGDVARLPVLIAESALPMHEGGALAETLTHALVATPLPPHTRDGGFIARGFAAELDEMVRLRDSGAQMIAGKAALYANKSGVASLKIAHNKILGYFIDVTPTHADKLLARDDLFIHRQTLANSVRFTTRELIELERDVASAGTRAQARERALFDDLVTRVLEDLEPLRGVAHVLALLDVLTASAEHAVRHGYVRPTVDDSLDLEIIGGRHLVVERTLGREAFVRNDCTLHETKRVCVLTGPNMAGKSTWLRQNALIIVLAQAGFFVPADRARIGIVDQLFSRVGAADNLARGQSTFMVEMVEAARILHQAEKRSFVILDEVGRGTATHDGLALARAILDHLHDVIQCRTLFATHYHELSDLDPPLTALWMATMRIREWQGGIVFLHEVMDGRADRSYGIHVANLAGLPKTVLERASVVLERLEANPVRHSTFCEHAALENADQRHDASPKEAHQCPLYDVLRTLDPDTLTPRQASDVLYRLCEMAQDKL